MIHFIEQIISNLVITIYIYENIILQIILK